jgi:hypothetical protein
VLAVEPVGKHTPIVKLHAVTSIVSPSYAGAIPGGS